MQPPTVAPSIAKHLEIRIGVSTRPPRGTECQRQPIPERLIVTRWKRLGTTCADGSVYRGCRLKPSLWRLVDGALSESPGLWALPTDKAKALLDKVRADAKAKGQHIGTIDTSTLLTLLRFLKRQDRLTRILAAHRAVPRHGIPDLLLYRERNGRAIDFRFVEVKRAAERVRLDQVEEIQLLRSVGLTAGIVRLDADRRRANGETARTRPRTRAVT